MGISIVGGEGSVSVDYQQVSGRYIYSCGGWGGAVSVVYQQVSGGYMVGGGGSISSLSTGKWCVYGWGRGGGSIHR